MSTDLRTDETTGRETLDTARVEAFAERLFGFYTGGMLTYLIDIGHRTGLFAAAARGPATSVELAERAGLVERYVREWLGAMVTGGVLTYEPEAAVYALPAEHAVCLTGGGATDIAPYALLNTHLAQHVEGITRSFREGGGVPYGEFRPEFTGVMDGLGRGGFDEALVDAWLPLVPDVVERLERGVRVTDVGCGTGHALVLLAEAFPTSEFVGYDIAEDAIALARQEAAEEGLDNVTFLVRDAATLTVDEPFDVAFVFDAVHDQASPAAMLRGIADALAPDGVFLMVEPAVSSHLEDNIAHPLAPYLYAISTLHCLTISLAEDGTGLGTAWGEQVARQMLDEAGFADVRREELVDEPVNALFVARK